MWFDTQIYDTDRHLVLLFGSIEVTKWCEVTVIVDGDKVSQSICGIEVIYGHDLCLETERMMEQFWGFENVSVIEGGFMAVTIRREPATSPGFGFGRDAWIGVDTRGYLSTIWMAWNSPGAGTPRVDRKKALAGLSYQTSAAAKALPTPLEIHRR